IPGTLWLFMARSLSSSMHMSMHRYIPTYLRKYVNIPKCTHKGGMYRAQAETKLAYAYTCILGGMCRYVLLTNGEAEAKICCCFCFSRRKKHMPAKLTITV